MTPGSMSVVPQNSVERIWNVCCLVLGLFVSALLISQLSAKMVRLQTLHSDSLLQMDMLNRFFAEQDVPLSLATRIRREVKSRAKLKKRITMHELPSLQQLPLQVQQELGMSIFARTLLSHSVFYTWCLTDEILLQEFTSKALDLSSCSRNDDLFVPLQEAKCIYFLQRGVMRYRREIWSADVSLDSAVISNKEHNALALQQQLKHEEIVLHPEDWASTIALWCHWNYVGRLNAEDSCDLISFAVDRMLCVLETHPHIMVRSQNYACAYSNLANTDDSEHACRADLDIPAARVLMALAKADRLMFSETILCSFMERHLDSTIDQFFPARRHKLSHAAEISLMDELELGKCVVTLGADHQLLRTVVLCALRITDHVGKVLILVADSNQDGAMLPQMVIPATKLKEKETAMAAVDRLVQDELPTLNGTLQFVECESSETNMKSKHGVHTVYHKTLYHMQLLPSENSGRSVESTMLELVARDDTAARSMSPSRDFPPGGSPRGILQKLEAIPNQREDGRVQLYAWLRDHEFESLKSGDQDALKQWLAKPQHNLGHEAPHHGTEVLP